MRIGCIGLGAMGEGIARNVLKKHGQLNVLAHRSRHAVERLVAAGAQELPSVAQMARKSDVILLCLPNSAVVEETISTMVSHLRAEKIIIDTGTSCLASTLALEQELSRKDIAFAEAPLTGGQAQAMAGELGALVGCPTALLPRISPVLEMFCATVQHFGPVGAGARAKYINNYMVMGIAALVTEAFSLARETDTDWAQLYDVIRRGSADSGVLRRIIGQAKDGDFSGYAFSVANAAKDMGYITSMTSQMDRNTALNQAVKAFFDDALAQGLGDRRLSELLSPELHAMRRADQLLRR